jgi:hypothetical protein
MYSKNLICSNQIQPSKTELHQEKTKLILFNAIDFFLKNQTLKHLSPFYISKIHLFSGLFMGAPVNLPPLWTKK